MVSTTTPYEKEETFFENAPIPNKKGPHLYSTSLTF